MATANKLKVEDVPIGAMCTCGHTAADHQYTTEVGKVLSWNITGCLHQKVGEYCGCVDFKYETLDIDTTIADFKLPVPMKAETGKPWKTWKGLPKSEPELGDMCECGHTYIAHSSMTYTCLHKSYPGEIDPEYCKCNKFKQKHNIKLHATIAKGDQHYFKLKDDDLVSGINLTLGAGVTVSGTASGNDGAFTVKNMQSAVKSLKGANVMPYQNKSFDVYGYNYTYTYINEKPNPLKKNFPKSQVALATKFLDEAGLPEMTVSKHSLEEIMLSFMAHSMEAVIQDRIDKAVEHAKGERRKNIAPIMRKNDRKFRKG